MFISGQRRDYEAWAKPKLLAYHRDLEGRDAGRYSAVFTSICQEYVHRHSPIGHSIATRRTPLATRNKALMLSPWYGEALRPPVELRSCHLVKHIDPARRKAGA